MKNPRLAPFRLLLVIILTLTQAASLGRAATDVPGPAAVYLVPAESLPAFALLRLQPVRLFDYGAFQWVELSPADAARLAASPVLAYPQPDAGRVQVTGFRFDPLLEGEPQLPAGMRAAGEGPGFRLVQFAGPLQDAWLEQVAGLGLRPLQYYPHNAFLVWGSARQAQAAQGLDFVRWQGAFHPGYKINTDLQGRRGWISNVDVFFYNDGNIQATLDALSRLGGRLLQHFPAQPDKAFYDAILQVDAAALDSIARLETVLWLGYASPRPLLDDEMSDQIVAGNYTAGVPFPGYQSWLTNLGYDGSGVIWAPIDTGVDYDHPDLGPSIIGGYSFPGACDPVGQPGSDCPDGGHGTHVSGIIGGTGIGDAGGPYTDPDGYLYGLGVAPGYSIYAMNSLSAAAWPPAGGWQEHSKRALLGGAIGGNNSWTTGEGTAHGYQASERTHDLMVQDGNFDTPDVAETFIEVFSAGNSGPAQNTLTAPKEAKNLIVVANSLNYRAGSIDSIASSSSRGPAVDGRWVPTIAAPGSTIASARNDDGGSCSTPISGTNNLYAFCSGTSMAAPHASGAVILITDWWRDFNAGANPSPAMAKALLVNSAVDMGAADIPNINEGWGRIHLPGVFLNPTNGLYFDQPAVFDAPGQTWSLTIAVDDPSQPLKVSLAWTDAAGAVGANPALVNNLDLTVVNGSSTYRGNVFASGWSTTGGSPDALNNLENVFIQNPQASAVITIQATNLAGDGVPLNGDPTDQHFALVCQNCLGEPDFNLTVSPAEQQVCIPGAAAYAVNLDQIRGFDQPVTLQVAGVPAGYSASFDVNPLTPPGVSLLELQGSPAAAGGTYDLTISGTAITKTHEAAVSLRLFQGVPAVVQLVDPPNGAQDQPLTPTLAWLPVPQATRYRVEVATHPGFASPVVLAFVEGASYTVETPLQAGQRYYWRVIAENVCGLGETSPVYNFSTELRFCATPDLPIPDNLPAGASASQVLPDFGLLNDLDVFIEATHTWVGDLSFTLEHVETGALATLIHRPGYSGSGYGCGGDNIAATLDDEAASPVETACNSVAVPAILGSFTPNEPLAAFDGQPLGGTWRLLARDHAPGYAGTLTSWCLLPAVDAPRLTLTKTPASLYPTPGQPLTYTITVTNDGLLDASAAVISDTLPAGLLFLGPVQLTPPQPGAILAQSGGDLPTLASNLVISAGQSLQLSLPVLLDPGLGQGVLIGNTAAVTSAETGLPAIDYAVIRTNTAPLAGDDAYTAAEDTPLSVTALAGLLANDSDLDSQPLTAVLLTPPAHGSLDLQADGSFLYTPAQDFAGSDAFSYRVSDGALASTGLVSIQVTAINDPPAFTSQPVLTATVGQTYTYVITAADVDAGDALAITPLSLPAWLVFTPQAGGGALSGAPAASDLGEHLVRLRVSDLAGSYTEQEFNLRVVANIRKIYLPLLIARQ